MKALNSWSLGLKILDMKIWMKIIQTKVVDPILQFFIYAISQWLPVKLIFSVDAWNQTSSLINNISQFRLN